MGLFPKIMVGRAYKLSRYIKTLPNLQAYYPLNETSGDAINRAPLTFGQYNGTVTSVTYGAAGKVGKAYGFNGSTSGVDITVKGILPTVYSVFCLFKVNSLASASPLYGEFDGSTALTKNYLFVNTTGKVTFDQFNPSGGSAASTTTVVVGQWYLAAGIQTATNARSLWINGVNEAQATETYSSGAPSLVKIGIRDSDSPNDRWANGSIQHVGIVHGVMTEGQLLKIKKLAGL